MNRNLPDVSGWQPAASNEDSLRNALMTACQIAQKRVDEERLFKPLPLDTLVHGNDRKIGGRHIAVSWRFARKRSGQILGFDAMSVDCVVSENAGLTRSNGHKDPGEIIFLVFLRRAFQIVVDPVRST